MGSTVTPPVTLLVTWHNMTCHYDDRTQYTSLSHMHFREASVHCVYQTTVFSGSGGNISYECQHSCRKNRWPLWLEVNGNYSRKAWGSRLALVLFPCKCSCNAAAATWWIQLPSFCCIIHASILFFQHSDVYWNSSPAVEDEVSKLKLFPLRWAS